MFSSVFKTITDQKLHHPVTGITTDSRDIKMGDLYLALKGNNADGHSFLNQAISSVFPHSNRFSHKLSFMTRSSYRISNCLSQS